MRGMDELGSSHVQRVVVRNNLFEDVDGRYGDGYGRFLMMSRGTIDVKVEHNTVWHTGGVMFAGGEPHLGFVFRDNLLNHNAYGFTGNGTSTGLPTLNTYFPSISMQRNVMAGGDAGLYPADNFYPASLDQAGFVNQAAGNYRLAATSPYKGQATDGKDVGCDIDALEKAMQPPSINPDPTPTPTPTPSPSPTPTPQSPYKGVPAAVPGTIQAEDFDNGGGGIAYRDLDTGNVGNQYRVADVDVRAVEGASNGFTVFNARGGEWLEYTINITTAGSYDLGAVVASRQAGGLFHLELDGVNVTGSIAVPTTGSWLTFQQASKKGVTLPAGVHILRLVLETNGVEGVCGDFDVINIAKAAPAPISPTLVSNAYTTATTLAGTTSTSSAQIATLLTSIEQAYTTFASESGSFTTAEEMDRGLRAALYFSRAALALSAEQLSSIGVQNRLQIAASQLGLVKNLMLPAGGGSSSTTSTNHASVLTAPVIGLADTRSSASFAPTLSALSLGSILGDAALSPLAMQTSFATQSASGLFPYELSGVSVTIGGKAAQLLAVSPSKVNFLVPAGLASGTAEVIVTSDAGYVSRGTTTISMLAPALFSVNETGAGAGIVLNAATGKQGPFDDLTPQNLGTDKRTRLMIMATGISGGGVPNTNASNDIHTGSGVLENFAESVMVEARLLDGRVFQLPIEFAGRQNLWGGLDQINAVLLPGLKGAGTVELTLVINGQRSNSTTISIR